MRAAGQKFRGERGATMVEWALVIALLGAMFATVSGSFLKSIRNGVATALVHSTILDQLTFASPTFVRVSAYGPSSLPSYSGYDLTSDSANSFFDTQAEAFITEVRSIIDGKLDFLGLNGSALTFCVYIIESGELTPIMSYPNEDCGSLTTDLWTRTVFRLPLLPFQDLFAPSSAYATSQYFAVVTAYGGTFASSTKPLMASTDLANCGSAQITEMGP